MDDIHSLSTLKKIFLAHLIHGFITYFHQTGASATHYKIIWWCVGFHLNIQWLTSMAIYSVQINIAQGLTCLNCHWYVDVFVRIEYYIDPITVCAILQGRCKDNFCQITKCFLLHTNFVQKGHCINDTSRRLRDHMSWWNLFFQMPCQSRFFGFLIVPLQLAREHDSILIDVLALHCMHKKHLIWFIRTSLWVAFILLQICISLNVLNFCFGVLSWNIKADSSVFVLFFLNDLLTSSPCLGM